MTAAQSDRNLINDYQQAAINEIDRLTTNLDHIRAVLEAPRGLDLQALVAARDVAKARWAAAMLKTRQLEDAARRVAHTALRQAMVGGDLNKLAGMLFERIIDPAEGAGGDVYVIANNIDFVIAAIWRGLCRVLDLDPAAATPPRLLLPCIIGGEVVIGWRVRGRWLPLIAEADAKRANDMLGGGC